MVVNSEVTSIRDADKVIGILNTQGIIDVKLIINKVSVRRINNNSNISMSDVVDVLGIPLLGIVYEDEEMVRTLDNTFNLRRRY